MTPQQRAGSGHDGCLIIGGAPGLTDHSEMFPLAWPPGWNVRICIVT
jgi:hypothetical protein